MSLRDYLEVHHHQRQSVAKASGNHTGQKQNLETPVLLIKTG